MHASGLSRSPHFLGTHDGVVDPYVHLHPSPPGTASPFARQSVSEFKIEHAVLLLPSAELLLLRNAGNIVNIAVMRAVIDQKEPDLLNRFSISYGFVQRWTSRQMGWTWRRSTGAASKLPETWRDEGTKMAKRIAVLMETWDVSSQSYYTPAHSRRSHRI